MSSGREALLERFRAGLLARIERIDAQLELLEDGEADANALKEALGELHTLKGEGRMLGLSLLADLAHALESWLGQGGAVLAAMRALDAMRKALGSSVEPEIADAVLESARLELGGDEHDHAAPLNGAALSHDSARTNGKAHEAGAAHEQGELHDDSPESDGSDGTEAGARAPGTHADEARSGKDHRYVQVDSRVVDDLCERLAELTALYGRLRGRTLDLVRSLPGGAKAHTALVEDFARVSTLVTDTTTRAWALRLVPVEPMLRELRRHARMLAGECRKNIAVTIEARGVELERNVLDKLWDSLLHLVQNAVDHGLEAEGERGDKPAVGSIVLSAHAAGPNVVICVEDDGRGVDASSVRAAAQRAGRDAEILGSSDEEALELLFSHGFSTRTEVSQVSGRGVGLAVVRRQVEALGGSVRVESKPGRGTRFLLTVPFTVTKERNLIVQIGSGLYAFPARTVRAVLGSHELPPQGQERRPVLRHRNQTLPLVSLTSALRLTSDTPESSVIVAELGGRTFALRVPLIVGDVELIRRPADTLLGGLTGIGATALLDDGRLVLMLDVAFLQQALSDNTAPLAATPQLRNAPRRRRILVADDSPVVTQLVQEILVSAGYSVQVTNDGTEALSAMRTHGEPDLVLSDLEMPTMGGFELLSEIRKKNQRLPFILLTTRGSVEDRQRATELGANAYLLKTGFKSDALLDLVRRFVPNAPATLRPTAS
ncbi:MAG TPA: response regulator [Polyangiaceae bacterium]|nr:response regulator [Polyangiaceae bacterium]